jgi:uncharacterized membrane protein YfcA
MQNWLNWIFIGIASGTLVGLTSLDLGLVAVPLIKLLFDSLSWSDALTYALLPLAFASLLSWLPKRQATDYFTAVQLAVFSLSGSLLIARFKIILPSWVLVFLFAATASLSFLYWFKDFRKIQPMALLRNREPVRHQEWLISLAGVILGALLTLSALSCFFFLVPLLIKTLKISRTQATATAGFALLLGVLGSLLIQTRLFAFTPALMDLAGLLGGFAVSFALGKLLTLGNPQNVKPQRPDFKTR